MLTITGGTPCKVCAAPSVVWDYDTGVASGALTLPLRGTYCEEHRPSWWPRYILMTEAEKEKLMSRIAELEAENAQLKQEGVCQRDENT